MRYGQGAVLTGAAILIAAAVMAESPPPFPDFTFKRESAPEPGSRPRITVQIDPAEQRAALARTTPPAPDIPDPDIEATAPPPAHDWFWQSVSTARDDSAGRFARALAALEDAPAALPVPRLQQLQDIAGAHGRDVMRQTVGTQISPALVLAVIAVESSGRADAVSHRGAEGLMQLIPATAQRFGVTDSHDTTQNITGGVRYLDRLMELFEGDAVLALAAYNAGEGAVTRHDGVPPYEETRGYVPKVLAAWRVARGLCATPPELPSDGCVLQRAAQEPS